jgi:WD40 repeat protein
VRFSPDGLQIAAKSEAKRMMRIWKWASAWAMTPPLRQNDEDVDLIAFSPDGHLVATAKSFGSLRLWNVSPSQRFAPVRSSDVRVVEFSPDGGCLAIGRNAGAEVRDSGSGALLHMLNIPGIIVSALRFSGEGHLLVTGFFEGVMVWDTRTGRSVFSTKLEHGSMMRGLIHRVAIS